MPTIPSMFCETYFANCFFMICYLTLIISLIIPHRRYLRYVFFGVSYTHSFYIWGDPSECVRGARGLPYRYAQNSFQIANLLAYDFGSFDYLCSFDSCTLASWCSPVSHTRSMPCRVGVNAALQLKVARARLVQARNISNLNQVKCAFDAPVHNKLSWKRHLLPLD